MCEHEWSSNMATKSWGDDHKHTPGCLCICQCLVSMCVNVWLHRRVCKSTFWRWQHLNISSSQHKERVERDCGARWRKQHKLKEAGTFLKTAIIRKKGGEKEIMTDVIRRKMILEHLPQIIKKNNYWHFLLVHLKLGCSGRWPGQIQFLQHSEHF